MNVEVEESRLHEITDPNIMTRLSSLSPAIVNALGKDKDSNDHNDDKNIWRLLSSQSKKAEN